MFKAVKFLIFLSLLITFFAIAKNVNASIIAAQTSAWNTQINAWTASQDLGNNLSGTVGKFTFRTLDLPNQFDYTANNARIFDKSNNFSFINGCNVGPNPLSGLTINKVNVPSGYQDVTIDYSCKNYDFIPGHSYMIRIANANLCNGDCIKFSGHAVTDGNDYYPLGGLMYSYYNQNCFSPIQSYLYYCHILVTPKDDLYFKLETKDIPPSAKTSLIFIPGIGGSELKVANDTFWSQPDGHGGNFVHAYSKDEKVWVNENEAKNFGEDDYFDILRLKPDGQTGEANLELTGTLFDGAYKPTLDFFTSNGYTLNKDLFIFPYDWRKDLSLTKPLLDTKIDAILTQTGSQKVDIVAHSMGGLVARNYIADFSKAQKVRKLIELGTPHLGSVDMIKKLMYGDCFTKDIVKNSPVCIGLVGSEVKDVVQNLTGAYQLAPSQKYFNFYNGTNNHLPMPFRDDRDIDDNGVVGSLNYNQIKNLLSNLGYNTSLFYPSETFHNNDNILDINNGVDVTIISGSGIDTLGQVIEKYKVNFAGIKIPEKDEIKINGDDTVPLFSASLEDLENNISLKGNAKNYYTKQDHSTLPTDNLSLNLVKNILNNIQTLPNGISTQPFTLNGKLISVHSPINIHIYDSNGNHTGPTANGDFEENIPGGSYETLDDAKFIFLPEDGIYSIKLEATDQGSFDFKIRDYKNDEITKTYLYKDIPLTDSTKAEATLDTNNVQSTVLHVDEDGNGQSDADLNPTSTLIGNANFDETPPKSTVILTGTEGNNGWYKSDVTVEIDAQDEASGSGIAKTEYSLDNGQTIQPYFAPFIIPAEGINKLKFRSEDLAGNEETPQEIEIKIDKTAPEAKIYIDQDKQDLAVIAIDENPSTVEKLDNIETKKKDDAIYKITDLAGNTLKLDVRDRDKEKQDRFSIFALTYNADSPIKEPANHFNVSYQGKKDKLNVKEQNFELKNDVKIRINYDNKKNKSTIITRELGSERTKEIKDGLILLNLLTNKGVLETSY